MGRRKGSKSTGIPQRTLEECIEYISILYKEVGSSLMTFDEMRHFMNLEAGAGKATAGALSQYGLAEREKKTKLWRLTDLGKRVAQRDRGATKEALERIPIFRDLSTEYWDQETTPGAIERHIRKHYKKGEYAIEIVKQFSDAKQLIQKLEAKPQEANAGTTPSLEMCSISRMVGQLFPPENKGKAMEVLNDLIKLSETHDLKKFAGFLEGIKVGLENKKLDDKQIFEEFRWASTNAIEIFESESKLKLKKHAPTKPEATK